MDEIQNRYKPVNDGNDSITKLKVELELEKKYKTSMKDLEMKVIENQNEKNQLKIKNNNLNQKIEKLKNELKNLEYENDEIIKDNQKDIEEAKREFEKQFNEFNSQIRNLKEEKEKGREYQIKLEYLTKDYESTNN